MGARIRLRSLREQLTGSARYRWHRLGGARQALGEGQLLVTLLRPPDHVGMPWRWLIELQSERARGVHHLQRHIPSAMEVASCGKNVPATVFPDLRFGQTVHPEDRELEPSPVR